jgi:glycosyltransferase involved in cell wall biosynthesis
MEVLFLTPWYPSEKDAMSGLFVHKHAEAVRAQGCEVRVLFSQGWCDTLRQYRALRREGWKPDIVQLNVIQKQGLLALWLKKRYGIPYIIVEHWSGYLPENGMFMAMSWLQRRFYQLIARHADTILTVSDRHAQAMQACGITNKHWGLIRNVVDDFFYGQRTASLKDKGQKTKILLHVSCFDERAKNVKGLLRAAKMLSEKRQDWRLVLVGTGIDYQEVRAYADTLHIPDGLLEWTGELTPREVAERMDQADMFVLPSHYENAPVVLSESLAKGLPIVASRVGGIPEMVNDECGMLVTPEKDEELAAALEKMLDHYQEYDKALIRQNGTQYSFGTVGAQLTAIYRTCVQG